MPKILSVSQYLPEDLVAKAKELEAVYCRSDNDNNDEDYKKNNIDNHFSSQADDFPLQSTDVPHKRSHEDGQTSNKPISDVSND